LGTTSCNTECQGVAHRRQWRTSNVGGWMSPVRWTGVIPNAGDRSLARQTAHTTGASPGIQWRGEADTGVGGQGAVKWAPTLRKRAERAQAHGAACAFTTGSLKQTDAGRALTSTHMRAGAVWASRGGQVHPRCGARIASALPVRRVARARELRVLRPGGGDLPPSLPTQQQVPDRPPCTSASRPHSPRARGLQQVEREHAARHHGAGAAAQAATFDTQLWKVRHTASAVEATAVAQTAQDGAPAPLVHLTARRSLPYPHRQARVVGGTGGACASLLPDRGTAARVHHRGRSRGARRRIQHQRCWVSSSGSGGR
jgi:hypothetical protein